MADYDSVKLDRAGIKARDDSAPLSPFLARVLAILACAGVFLGYFITNHYSIGRPAIALDTWIDRAVPFMPAWEHFYVAIYLFLFVPVLQLRDINIFKRTALAFVVTQLIAYACFLACPVQMVLRPEGFDTTTFTGWGAAMNYHLDPPYNCFPSLHLSNAFLVSFIACKVDRPIGVMALVLATLIGVSTLFAKQHFLVDVIAGVGLGYMGYRLFVAPYDTRDIPRTELAYPRRYLLSLPALQGVGVLVVYILFRAGWRPFEA